MDDALVVSGGEGIGERNGDLEEACERQAPLGNEAVEGVTLHPLHGQEVDPVRFLHGVESHDVGMIEGGDRSGFTLEPLEPGGVGGRRRRKHLEGNSAVELRVLGEVHLTHAPRAELLDEAVVCEPSGGQGQRILLGCGESLAGC